MTELEARFVTHETVALVGFILTEGPEVMANLGAVSFAETTVDAADDPVLLEAFTI